MASRWTRRVRPGRVWSGLGPLEEFDDAVHDDPAGDLTTFIPTHAVANDHEPEVGSDGVGIFVVGTSSNMIEALQWPAPGSRRDGSHRFGLHG